MNVREMQYEFGIQMNQFAEPLALTSDDILYWLNKAQEHFVITRYNAHNQLGKGFEQSQQLVDDLKTIYVKDVNLPVYYAGGFEHAIDGFYTDYAQFKDDHLFLINQRSKIAYKHPNIEFTIVTLAQGNVYRIQSEGQGAKIKVVSNRFSQSDDIFTLLNDPFNTTKASSPLTDVSDKGITIYTDKTFLVRDVIISYIRRPKELSLEEEEANYTTTECELPKHTHKEIIQLAVDLFLQNTRELKQRLQRETPTADKQQNVEENE